MSQSPEQPPDGHQPGYPADVTREMPAFPPPPPAAANVPTGPMYRSPGPASGPSPWSREYAGPAPTYPAPPSGYAAPEPPGWPAASSQGWPAAPQQGWPSSRSRRGLWTGVTLVAVAIVATLIAVLVSTNSGSSKSSASGGTVQPIPPPTVAPTPAPSSTSPQNPLPSLGAVTTPPGLAAIGYRAYALSTLDPSDIALGPGELTQFKTYGLSRAVGLRALTLGSPPSAIHSWDADINILRFSSPAAAAAELTYSNTENKKTASTIPLPGLPNATAFVNHDATDGISIGAFTTVGRYQVVVILSGLSQNVPTDASVVAAEAARVMKAVLPDAATIVPPPSGSGGGGGPAVPGFPAPSPTGTHA